MRRNVAIRGAARLASLALLLFLAGFSAGNAGDLEPLLPQPQPLPAPAPFPELSGGPDVDDAPAADTVLIERLDAITFTCFQPLPPASPHVAETLCQPWIKGVANDVEALVPALATDTSPLIAALRAALAGPLTWGELDAVLTATTNAARAYGWSLARAFAPEQELTGGTLRIEVIPVWMEKATVEGAGWSNPERLRRAYDPFVGRVMNLSGMEPIHSAHNQHPFRRIAPSLTPGTVDGSTIYTLNVQESRPWRVFSNYETTHSRTSGSGRFTGGATFAAPWRTDDIVTMQYSRDNKFDHLQSFALVYRHALPWRHFLTVTGLWSESDTLSDAYFAQNSKDALVRLAYTVPLPEWQGVTHSLEAGWEWRRSHARNDFSGVTFFDNVYVSAPLSLGWRGRRADARGVTGLSAELVVGPGGYFGNMDKTAYDFNRPGAKRHWLAVRPELRRDWRLPLDFLASQRLWAQWSPHRLADAGQFYLGGNRNVRGYRESEVSGDKGFGVSLEVQTPSLWKHMLPCSMVKASPTDDSEGRARTGVTPDLRLAAFWDWGVVKRNGPLEAYERNKTVMNGAGLGLRFGWGEWVNVQADYAWRLRDTGIAGDDRKDGFWHVAASIGF
ncbi:MAG: hypothetical protein LIQ31_04260 [Planctomycetes bacterium]|nr:hypothetical protein [Planctomycetota bacterium]